MDLKELLTGNKGKKIPVELKEFNWGAFLLTFIWGIKHKAWITLLAIPLIWFQMPYGFNWILYTILQIYCGIKGNEWAYQVDWWKKPRDFRLTQAKWAVVALSINIIVPIILLTITGMFIKKSPDNPSKLIQNSQCVVSYNKIKRGLKDISYSTKTKDFEIAEAFAKQFKNTKIDGNKVIFYLNQGSSQVDTYEIVFNKVNNDASCTLIDKNCSIQSSFVVPTDTMNFGECNFYFDISKHVEPDKETRKSIDKGFNIFKYL